MLAVAANSSVNSDGKKNEKKAIKQSLCREKCFHRDDVEKDLSEVYDLKSQRQVATLMGKFNQVRTGWGES